MKKIIFIIYLCLITLTTLGCNEIQESNVNDIPQDSKLNMFTLDFQDDVYFLMGMDYALFQKILDKMQLIYMRKILKKGCVNIIIS